MSSLRDVVEQAVAAAFAAGAEWRALADGHDSAVLGREMGRWPDDRRYQQMLRRRQEDAAEQVGRAIMRIAVGAPGGQARLFEE